MLVMSVCVCVRRVGGHVCYVVLRFRGRPAYVPSSNWSWKSSACVCGAARKMMSLLCLCVHRNMNVFVPPHPAPHHPSANWSWKSSACVRRTARKMMRLLCLCVHRNMNVITPPHWNMNERWSGCASEWHFAPGCASECGCAFWRGLAF